MTQTPATQTSISHPVEPGMEKPGLGVALLVLLPMLNLSVPGILPTPTCQPGSLQLLALCMLMAAAALSYHLLLGIAGLLSFSPPCTSVPAAMVWPSS